MKRIKKISLILFFVLLFIPFTSINADRKATCADVMDAINELEDLDSTYTKLDCENAVESKIIYKCNKNRIRKSEVLEDIFMYNDKKVCPSIDLSSIISTYKDDCSNELSSKIKEVSDTVMKIFFVSAPFILILFGSLDFFKIVTASDAREIKKNRSNFIKRVIAFVLLYITPFIVKTLFSFTPYEMDGGYICAQEIDFNAKISTGEISGLYGGNNFGIGVGSSVVTLSDTSDRDGGEYIVVNNSFPGGVQGFSNLIIKNGICQSSTGSNEACISSEYSPNGWGQCCAGIAQIQACGFKKGITLTQKNSGLIVGNGGCNNPSNNLGCSGIWTSNNDTCFETEKEYVQFVIKNIQNGTPVFTLAGTSSRHFITIVGFKKGASGTSHEDLLLLDSWDGRLETFKKRKLGKKSNIGNHPCKGHDGEYWASPLIY